jgi:hypothetical protein
VHRNHPRYPEPVRRDGASASASFVDIAAFNCLSAGYDGNRSAFSDTRGVRAQIANSGDVPNIKRVERDIKNVEGFDVVIHGDRANLPGYAPIYARSARNAFSVADWKRARFEKHYPDCDVDVLRADGRIASDKVTLAKLRGEYE